MRKVFLGFAVLLLVVVLAQFYLATFGAFQTPHPAPGDEDGMINYHVANGTIILPIVSLLTTIVAAVARAGARNIWLAIAPVGLVIVQLLVIFPLAELAGATEEKTTTASLFVMGFHAIVGVVLLWVAVELVRRARALVKEEAAAQAGVTAGV
jgi:hypothetical protein